MSAPTFRRLDDPPGPGAWNMAVDEALLRACQRGDPGFPCVRFYAWDPPALSLGFRQDVERAVRRPELGAMGIDLVRRPTGGRAVLHRQELTYAVVASCRQGALAGPVMTSYRRISEALVRGLARLGVDAKLSSGFTPARRASVEPCFARSSRCEVEVGGAKIVGSVQVQRGGCLLQHGSLPFRSDPLQLQRATGGRPATALGLEDLLGARVGHRQVADALAAGFEDVFAARLQPGVLSEAEEDLARQLQRRRYTNPQWTLGSPAEVMAAEAAG